MFVLRLTFADAVRVIVRWLRFHHQSSASASRRTPPFACSLTRRTGSAEALLKRGGIVPFRYCMRPYGQHGRTVRG